MTVIHVIESEDAQIQVSTYTIQLEKCKHKELLTVSVIFCLLKEIFTDSQKIKLRHLFKQEYHNIKNI